MVPSLHRFPRRGLAMLAAAALLSPMTASATATTPLPPKAASPAKAASPPKAASPAKAAKLWAVNQGLAGPFFQLEGHLSLLSGVKGEAIASLAFGYALRGGYRYKGWGVFLQLEQDLWYITELDRRVVAGAFNIGVGFEVIYAKGLLRSAFAVGPSILVTNTALDSIGSVGVFIDVRPLGLRFRVHPNVVMGLDPLGFALVAPVLRRIPLIHVEYRNNVYVEVGW